MAPPTCPLCGRPIDYSLDWYVDPKDGKRKRHPMSAEIDEIVPVSKGGSPIDMENLRVVHRICNQRRGNKQPIAAESGNIQPMQAKKRLQMPLSCDW